MDEKIPLTTFVVKRNERLFLLDFRDGGPPPDAGARPPIVIVG